MLTLLQPDVQAMTITEMLARLKQYQLLPQFQQELIIDSAIAEIACTPDEIAAAHQQLIAKYQLTSDAAKAQFCQQRGLTAEDLDALLTRLRRFAQRFCTIVRVVTWIVMKPYSLDLREKIISTYEAGNTSIRQVAARFQVSKNTVQSLLKRKQATGTLKPAPATGGKTSQLAGFEQEIAEMVEQHQDYTLAEYCESWQEKLG
ncbi:MAG: IS630 transposase-related protein [Leptolyngbya sp. IPPAS B-1204]